MLISTKQKNDAMLPVMLASGTFNDPRGFQIWHPMQGNNFGRPPQGVRSMLPPLALPRGRGSFQPAPIYGYVPVAGPLPPPPPGTNIPIILNDLNDPSILAAVPQAPFARSNLATGTGLAAAKEATVDKRIADAFGIKRFLDVADDPDSPLEPLDGVEYVEEDPLTRALTLARVGVVGQRPASSATTVSVEEDASEPGVASSQQTQSTTPLSPVFEVDESIPESEKEALLADHFAKYSSSSSTESPYSSVESDDMPWWSHGVPTSMLADEISEALPTPEVRSALGPFVSYVEALLKDLKSSPDADFLMCMLFQTVLCEKAPKGAKLITGNLNLGDPSKVMMLWHDRQIPNFRHRNTLARVVSNYAKAIMFTRIQNLKNRKEKEVNRFVKTMLDAVKAFVQHLRSNVHSS